MKGRKDLTAWDRTDVIGYRQLGGTLKQISELFGIKVSAVRYLLAMENIPSQDVDQRFKKNRYPRDLDRR